MAFPRTGVYGPPFINPLISWAEAITDPATSLALFTDSVTGADLNAYQYYDHEVWASNEVPTGNGYVAGGQSVVATLAQVAGGFYGVYIDPPTWEASTITGAAGGLLYAPNFGNVALVTVRFREPITSSAGDLTVDFNVPVVVLQLNPGDA